MPERTAVCSMIWNQMLIQSPQRGYVGEAAVRGHKDVCEAVVNGVFKSALRQAEDVNAALRVLLPAYNEFDHKPNIGLYRDASTSVLALRVACGEGMRNVSPSIARPADLKIRGAQQVAHILGAFFPNDELYFLSFLCGGPITRKSAASCASWCARAPNAVYHQLVEAAAALPSP